jgi:hypothetical protein
MHNQMAVEICSARIIGTASDPIAMTVPDQKTIRPACFNPRASNDAMAPASAAARGTTAMANQVMTVGIRSISTIMGTPMSRAKPYTNKLRIDDHAPVTKPA